MFYCNFYSGTPISNITEKDPVLYVKRLFEMNEKENVGESRAASLSNTPSKKRLNDTNDTSFLTNGGSFVEQKRSLLCCFGPDNQCPVHEKNENKLAWGYYNSPEVLDDLIDNLNSRGVRESELKKILLQEKQRIISSMEKCTNCLLNPSLVSYKCNIINYTILKFYCSVMSIIIYKTLRKMYIHYFLQRVIHFSFSQMAINYNFLPKNIICYPYFIGN